MAADREKPCYMLGPVIHNDHVTAHLEEKGIVCLPDVRDIPPGTAVILRSHGEGKAVYDALAAKGCKTIDAACPNVTKIHRLVERAEESGRQPCHHRRPYPSRGGRYCRMVPLSRRAGGCGRPGGLAG